MLDLGLGVIDKLQQQIASVLLVILCVKSNSKTKKSKQKIACVLRRNDSHHKKSNRMSLQDPHFLTYHKQSHLLKTEIFLTGVYIIYFHN